METFETRDLNLAAALITTGETYDSVRAEGNHAVFIFQVSEALERTTVAFYKRSLQVDAITFGECMRSAKAAALAARNRETGLVPA